MAPNRLFLYYYNNIEQSMENSIGLVRDLS